MKCLKIFPAGHLRERPLVTAILFVSVLSMLCAMPAWGEQHEAHKLTASDGEVGDCFGYSVSLSGEVALIGAYSDASYTGSAYVVRYDAPMVKASEKARGFRSAAFFPSTTGLPWPEIRQRTESADRE